MPSPIQPNNLGGSGVSFLPSLSPDLLTSIESTASSSISDSDADILIELWSSGEKQGDRKYAVPKGFSSKSLTRLKTSGLITINGNEVEFTPKASTVIKTMVLAEQNHFLEKRQKKPYSLILAESKKPVRTSALTHTAQNARALSSRDVYVWTQRVALIDQGKNHFKDYTVRVYHSPEADRPWVVWTFNSRIGSSPVARINSDWPNQRSAINAAVAIVDKKLSEGYEPGRRLGAVRSWTNYQSYDLTVSNPLIPGTYSSPHTLTDSSAVPQDQPTNQSAPRPKATAPATPAAPAKVPENPTVVPTKHVEERNLPEGYSINGPVDLNNKDFAESRKHLDSITNPIGYYVTDPEGKIVPRSAGATPEQSVESCMPIVLMKTQEKRLPKGFAIVGPPLLATPANLFIVRNPEGISVASGRTPHEAADSAMTSPEVERLKKREQQSESPQAIANRKSASELSARLPDGYRFDEVPNANLNDPPMWRIIDTEGTNVSRTDETGAIFNAFGKNPSMVITIFEDIQKKNAEAFFKQYLDSMKGSEGGKRISSVKPHPTKTSQSQNTDEPQKLGAYYHRNDAPAKSKFIQDAAIYLKHFGELLSKHGFDEISINKVPGNGAEVFGTFFMSEFDSGIYLYLGSINSPNEHRSDGTLLLLAPCSKTTKKSPLTEKSKWLDPNMSTEELVDKAIEMFASECPEAGIDYMSSEGRKLFELYMKQAPSSTKRIV
jgi:hypothetical protein